MQGLTAIAVGMGFLAIAPALQAHGVDVTYTSTAAIQVQAAFASGEPMVNAQVSVFTPTDPQPPWATGTTDPFGSFAFVPDITQPGQWEVQVRLAGHGDILSIPIEASDTAAPAVEDGAALAIVPETIISERQLPIGQKLAVGVLFAWGCVGTALYFKRESAT